MPKIINTNPGRRPPPSLPKIGRQHSTFSLIFWCAIGAFIGLEASNLSTAALEWFQLGLIVIIALAIVFSGINSKSPDGDISPTLFKSITGLLLSLLVVIVDQQMLNPFFVQIR